MSLLTQCFMDHKIRIHSKIETHTWERRIPWQLANIADFYRLQQYSWIKPMPDNYSLGSLPSSRGLFFSYPECKGAWALESLQ